MLLVNKFNVNTSFQFSPLLLKQASPTLHSLFYVYNSQLTYCFFKEEGKPKNPEKNTLVARREQHSAYLDFILSSLKLSRLRIE